MKKLTLIAAMVLVAGTAYGAQLELKAGFEPWREGKNSHADFNEGASLGAEVLFNSADHPFDYGVGIEWKSDFSGDSHSENNLASSESDAIPVYLTGKYTIGEDLFYLVGRAGWTIYDDADTGDGFYSAAGIGKQYGNITVETLYEAMDIDGSSKLYSGEQAGLVSIKIGYRIGENKRDKIAREADIAAKAEYERQQANKVARVEAEKQAQLEKIQAEEAAAEVTAQYEARKEMLGRYKSYILADSYDPNKTEPSRIEKDFFNQMKSDLAGERGILEVSAYTDNTGSQEYNKKLSEKRAERAKETIDKALSNENVKVISYGRGETDFLNDNSTKELRRENRRVEINFIPKDSMTK